VTEPVTIPPALPDDVPAPGADGSNIVTRCPSCARARAVAQPTIPPPIIAIESGSLWFFRCRMGVIPIENLVATKSELPP
jgi:hypothetical protein